MIVENKVGMPERETCQAQVAEKDFAVGVCAVRARISVQSAQLSARIVAKCATDDVCASVRKKRVLPYF